VSQIVIFPNFWHFVTFFIHMCKLNTVANPNSAIFKKIICKEATSCLKTLIVCATAVINELRYLFPLKMQWSQFWKLTAQTGGLN